LLCFARKRYLLYVQELPVWRAKADIAPTFGLAPQAERKVGQSKEAHEQGACFNSET
jgi:hypothetical protein